MLKKAWDVSYGWVVKKADEAFKLGLRNDPGVAKRVMSRVTVSAPAKRAPLGEGEVLDTMKVHRVYSALLDSLPLLKEDRDRAAMIVRTGVRLIRLFAVLSWPVIPEAAERVLVALGEPEGMPQWPDGDSAAELAKLESGRTLGDPGILFRKLPPEEVEALAAEFRGL